MKLIKPKALKPGDTLGIVACSTPITASSNETIERAYKRLRERGFNLLEAPNCRKIYGHAAGAIKDRVMALHDFFRDSKVDGILHYWGGYQSHQLLEYLDYDLIKKRPKPFIGYSDTTALQIGLYSKIGLVTFSGPAGITYGKPVVPEFTWGHFEKVVMNPDVPLKLGTSREYSDNPWYIDPDKQMRFEPNQGWRIFRKGRAEGAIVAGNLGTMLLLAGTEYWPDLRGKILFVEDDEAESTKTMDRKYTQLRHMGVYEQISGMVVGRFHRDVKFRDDDSLGMILGDALRGYDFPVITGVDFGHTDPLVTLPIGIKCRVNTARCEIALLENAVIS